MTELEKSEKWINENWKYVEKGVRVRTHHDYTSVIVDKIIDGDDPVTANMIIVYKDWNKYKRRWDYHCEEIHTFLFNVSLYTKIYNGKFGEGKIKKEYA